MGCGKGGMGSMGGWMGGMGGCMGGPSVGMGGSMWDMGGGMKGSWGPPRGAVSQVVQPGLWKLIQSCDIQFPTHLFFDFEGTSTANDGVKTKMCSFWESRGFCAKGRGRPMCLAMWRSPQLQSVACSISQVCIYYL